MGDTACLMQPFCYASGISNEANQSNPIHALGQSISFGRFVSESLEWEKWSTFSHNRYVEEAERYSRPGLVAQKKAFFEAHYKKLAAQKAAALLQQENNAASNNVTEQEHKAVVDTNHNSQTMSPSNSKLEIKQKQDFKVLYSQPDILSSNGSHLNSNIDACMTESNQLEEADPDTEHQPFVGNSVKVEYPILKLWQQSSNSDKKALASASKKKAPVSSLKATETSKFTSTPVKSAVPISSKKDNFATPTSKKPALSSADKQRSTPKSLYMSVNFTPIRELNSLTKSVMRKFESTRVGAASSNPSKDISTPIRTPTTVSKNEGPKHSPMTPSTEEKRKKMRSPIISSPFSLRTEERAARRKKKLEEKFNANEAHKVQLHTKLKEKAETEIRKLRQSFCFKASPLHDFSEEREASKEETNKGPLTHPESSKQGRKPILSVVERKTTLPPQRPPAKNDGIKGSTSTHPLTSNSILNNMRIHGTKTKDITKPL